MIGFFRQYNRDLWVLATGSFAASTGFAIWVPFIAVYFSRVHGLSPLEVGYFFTAIAVIRSAFQAVGGELSDRIGRTPLLVQSQFARAVTFLALGYVIANDMSFWWIAGLLTVNSILGALFMPAMHALVSDILPQEQHLDGYAIIRAAGNLGWGAGPALGGLLAEHSYSLVFYLASAITIISALIFWLALKVPPTAKNKDRFKFSDLVALTRNKIFAAHMLLTLSLYLVVAQLMAPLSLYAVEFSGLRESQLGWLYMVNGLMVSLLQIPVTRLIGHYRLTTQLAMGALLYWVGYGVMGLVSEFWLFMGLIVLITTGEIFMSPPSLALTSRMAPEGRTGRYMGVHGFFTAMGWSLGPMYGGFFLNVFESNLVLAWICIATLAAVALFGYRMLGRRIPAELDEGRTRLPKT